MQQRLWLSLDMTRMSVCCYSVTILLDTVLKKSLAREHVRVSRSASGRDSYHNSRLSCNGSRFRQI